MGRSDVSMDDLICISIHIRRIQKLLSEGRKAFRCTETFKDVKAAREPLEEDISV